MRPLTLKLAAELSSGKPTPVKIPHHDCLAWVRPLKALELSGLAELGEGEGGIKLVSMSLCDEHGKWMEASPEDVGTWPASLFQPILTASIAANGLDDVTAPN